MPDPLAPGIAQFLRHHYRHFNAAALVDAAEGYRQHVDAGGKMLVSLAGAMSTAELGLSLAEMIRQDKVHIISCTGANLEEDLFNLVAHDHYERVPRWRDLTPADEQALLDRGMNRVTDTCIPEEEAFRRLEAAILDEWQAAEADGDDRESEQGARQPERREDEQRRQRRAEDGAEPERGGQRRQSGDATAAPGLG